MRWAGGGAAEEGADDLFYVQKVLHLLSRPLTHIVLRCFDLLCGQYPPPVFDIFAFSEMHVGQLAATGQFRFVLFIRSGCCV